MKALIVDSSVSARNVISILLRRHDIEVVQTPSGLIALEYLLNTTFDLLVFSSELEDMAGMEFYNQFRVSNAAQIPISLLVTGSSQKEFIAQAIEAEVTSCFSKLELSALETFIANLRHSNHTKYTGNLLLVEDSMSAAMLYSASLTRLGFTLDHCIDAEGAISHIQQKQYDLIITDFNLSGLGDGFSVIRAVKSSPHPISLTPVLAMSGLNNPSRRAQLLMNGASDFYAKSSSVKEFEIRVIHLVTNHKHTQKLDQQYKAMHDMATHDALTKLYNRHYLEMIQGALISNAHQKNEPLTMMLLDLDYFKKINDTYGHKTGDQVLVACAETIRNFFIEDDLLFRIGGEEFLVLLPNVSLGEASIKANKLCFQLQQAHLCGLNITISIGASEHLAGESYDQLFLRTDAALNLAKQNGRSRVCVIHK